MTDREKAIVMAHTGICMLEGEKLGVFYQYLAELYGRPVYTHEWATLDIKEKSKSDFLQLCKEEEPEITRCKDCVYGYLYVDIQYGVTDSWIECRNPEGLNRDVSVNGYCAASIRKKVKGDAVD